MGNTAAAAVLRAAIKDTHYIYMNIVAGRDNLIDIATRIWTEGMSFESLLRQVIHLFPNVQTGSWAHPVSYSVGTGFFTRVKAART
jgi:hypothetical protein